MVAFFRGDLPPHELRQSQTMDDGWRRHRAIRLGSVQGQLFVHGPGQGPTMVGPCTSLNSRTMSRISVPRSGLFTAFDPFNREDGRGGADGGYSITAQIEDEDGRAADLEMDDLLDRKSLAVAP